LSIAVDWAAPAQVGAYCSGREGGVSTGAYASLNLGDHVGDDLAAVARNRERFAQALAARPVYLQQVHGADVVRLDASTPDGTRADACWTSEPRVACTIMVADCLPLLFAVDGAPLVGAAHAGWRGLAGGVIERLWDVLRGNGAAAPRTHVWLGPCIGPEAFEVGEDVRDAFTAADAGAATFFRPRAGGKFLADLQGLARARLQALGLSRVSGNDGTRAWCTVANPSRFFSHRRDRTSGRFAAAVWLR
jgi:YfiH family protein